ncbi:50S ribosomal protein L10 [candidate division KSB1 bacterium]|nr:MAG: 50S ribosomal protein L10 [candidate division KSB1 bacterium]RKY77424.1 MAG: 50S ribosomal protein L10 [candidate division KSB1 bacterium]RKY83699.1 MAG: 50S ribosomal protein L10 [candidate division KSB1 bacterium]RKY88816.1 MAG: 50S ribosomal protein L10 [candidate division KSB1 bacterium]RKY92396.1 MAG: 50S ribosomal protein L10 [candidate division KSB1 bacterium]
MVRPEKQLQVEQISKKFREANSVFLTDFSGLNVEEITKLRRSLREASVDFKVVKNTLARRSLQEVGYEEILDSLRGPTAFAFAMDDPVAAARIIMDFAKKTEKPKIKGIIFEGRVLDASEASMIAALPPREVLIARVVGGISSPLVGFVGGLQAILRNLVGVLNAVCEKKSE